MRMNHPLALLDLLAADEPALAGLPRLARYLARMPWFGALARPLDDATVETARACLAGLGIPDADPVPAESLADVEEVLAAADPGNPLALQEEQRRAELADRVRAQLAQREALEEALTVLKGLAAVTAGRAIEEDGVFPPATPADLLDAAVGAAAAATVDAALVLAAGAGAAHPFALRFALFEKGRWPLALIGATWHIY